ncbi:MAG: polysaccharide deacetylase family protein [Defluviitaleaceae bacterium]|nr:polysaccharide deacetylase family protein [Defluviitaleaceae bacterium]
MQKIILIIIFLLTQTNTIIAMETNTEKLIAITFDDGPSRYTESILDIFYKNDSHATFFVLGNQIERNLEIFLKIYERGHEIGNHTFFHENVTRLSRSNVINTIVRTSNLIEKHTGVYPTLFRPPFGEIKNRERDILRILGYSIILWSVDPRDWNTADSNKIFEHIINNARHGSIILLHDTRKSTYEAIAKAVPYLIENGFRLVTVSELLENTRAGNIYRNRH